MRVRSRSLVPQHSGPLLIRIDFLATEEYTLEEIDDVLDTAQISQVIRKQRTTRRQTSRSCGLAPSPFSTVKLPYISNSPKCEIL